MKALVTAIILSTMLTVAGTAKESVKAEVPVIRQDIKKIRVTGNLIVYLVQGHREEVTIDEGDPEEISVKQAGNTLSITADENTQGVVTVYFKDIFRVDASNASTILSTGTLHMDYLQVLLKDNARATIKADTRSLYTVTDGNSKLQLRGSATEHIVQTYGSSELKFKHFIAQTTKQVHDNEMLARKESTAIPAKGNMR